MRAVAHGAPLTVMKQKTPLGQKSEQHALFSPFCVGRFLYLPFFWGATFVEMLDLGQIITVRLAVVPVGPIPFLGIPHWW